VRFIRNVNGFLAGVLLVCLFAYFSNAEASGTDVEVETLVNTETNVINELGGDSLNISGDKAFAVGGSSFDVDINQCLASKATNVVVVGWQTLVENATCIADGLDARGNHDAAARVRCKHVETVYSSFDGFKKCVTAVTMVPVRSLEPPEQPKDIVKDHDEDDRYSDLEQQLTALVEDKAKSDRAAARYVTQQRKIKAEDREYAQQLIEQLEQQRMEVPQQIEEPASER